MTSENYRRQYLLYLKQTNEPKDSLITTKGFAQRSKPSKDAMAVIKA